MGQSILFYSQQSSFLAHVVARLLKWKLRYYCIPQEISFDSFALMFQSKLRFAETKWKPPD